MADTQREPRVTDSDETPQTEELHSPEASVQTVARQLANPRRIRRD